MRLLRLLCPHLHVVVDAVQHAALLHHQRAQVPHDLSQLSDGLHNLADLLVTLLDLSLSLGHLQHSQDSTMLTSAPSHASTQPPPAGAFALLGSTA